MQSAWLCTSCARAVVWHGRRNVWKRAPKVAIYPSDIYGYILSIRHTHAHLAEMLRIVVRAVVHVSRRFTAVVAHISWICRAV